MTATSRRFAIPLSMLIMGSTLAVPAGAQFTSGRSAFDQRPVPESIQFGDFFGGDRRSSYRNNSFDPFWGDRRSSYPNNSYNPFNQLYRRPQPQTYESIKPPAPRKVETSPSETVVVVGDSFGDWLGYGLEQVFAEKPEIGIVRKIKTDFGLARDDPHADAPEWSRAIKDLLPPTEKPNAIVVMLGVNDRLPLRERVPATKEPSTPSDNDHPAPAAPAAQHPPLGGNYEFHTDKWAELYSKRIDDMIATLKTRGVPILWVGLPAIRGAKSTSDMQYLDELYRARAEKAGITYVDIWDGFVDDQGRYAQEGPDFEGQTRRLRTYDGVYFTKAGAEKLGHYVEHELRRVLTNPVVPVALPGPEEQPPAKGGISDAKPAIGPVVPLSAIGGGEGGDLLGAASRPAEGEADTLTKRVLNRGDAIVAPRGRADDFSWPRPDPNARDAADEVLAPEVTPPKVSSDNGGVEDGKKNANKAETIKSSNAENHPPRSVQPTPHRLTNARPRLPGDQFNATPPRPPLPIGRQF
jgi:uncharacterized protein